MPRSPEVFKKEALAFMDRRRKELERTFFTKFIEGRLSRQGIHNYYRRLYHECTHFVRMIGLVHFNAVHRDARELMARNLVEEYANGKIEFNHPWLAMNVAVAMGLDAQAVEDAGPTPEITAYFDDALFKLAHSSFLEGLAVLCFHEGDLPTRHLKMRDALIKHYGADPKDLRYYDEHISESSTIRDGSGYGGDDVHVARQMECIAKYAVTDKQQQSVLDAIDKTFQARNALNIALDRECGQRARRS